MTGATEAVAMLRREVEGMGREWSVELDLGDEARAPYRTVNPRKKPPGPQPTNGAVVDHLARMRRDPFAVTDEDRAAMIARAVERHAAGVRGAALWTGVSSTWRGRVYDRVVGGTAADPVSPAWAARKARLGYPVTPSVASGQLARAIRSAPLRVRRTR